MSQLQESLRDRSLASGEKYKGHKKELYPLAGVLIDEVVIRMLGNFSKNRGETGLLMIVEDTIAGAYGLEQDDNTSQVRGFYRLIYSDDLAYSGDFFETIVDGMENSFQFHWSEMEKEIKRRKKGAKNTPLQNAYDRYQMLTAGSGIEPEDFLRSGLSKKLDVMKRLAVLIPHFYTEQTGEEITAEKFEEIAYASFPLLEKMARTNGGDLMSFLNTAFAGWNKYTGWRGLKADLFQLTGSDGKLRLDLSEAGKALYEQSVKDGEKVVGCPALTVTKQPFVSFQHPPTSSPLEKMWRWYVDILSEHLLEEVKEEYEHLVDSNQDLPPVNSS